MPPPGTPGGGKHILLSGLVLIGLGPLVDLVGFVGELDLAVDDLLLNVFQNVHDVIGNVDVDAVEADSQAPSAMP